MRKFRYIESGHGDDSLCDHETNELDLDFDIQTEGYYALMPVTKEEFDMLEKPEEPARSTQGETVRISSVVAERFMQMDQDIQEFIRQEVEAALDRRENAWTEGADEPDIDPCDVNPVVKTGTVSICSVCGQVIIRDPYNPNYLICSCVDIGQVDPHDRDNVYCWRPASVEIRMKKEVSK